MNILVTGSSGFIASYLVQELLDKGHIVYGVDNFTKYGESIKSYGENKDYHFVKGDVKDLSLMKELIEDCDQIVACAAMIGGISYFHEYAYDLLAENERIAATTFDAAIWAFENKKLQKINVLSSSMVYESTKNYPTPEGDQFVSPPPMSTYGFQKLAIEYFAKGAWEQYKLPYTIIRPFNCIGVGEKRAISDSQIMSGNIKLAMSHVVPDIIQKIIKGQDPLHIIGDGNQIRHYTYAGDLVDGIIKCMLEKNTINNDFNLSTSTSTTVLELAELIWRKINPDKNFNYVCDDPFMYDVQKRIPDTSKAKEVLNFEAKTKLDVALDEIIPWVREQIALGTI